MYDYSQSARTNAFIYVSFGAIIISANMHSLRVGCILHGGDVLEHRDECGMDCESWFIHVMKMSTNNLMRRVEL